MSDPIDATQPTDETPVVEWPSFQRETRELYNELEVDLEAVEQAKEDAEAAAAAALVSETNALNSETAAASSASDAAISETNASNSATSASNSAAASALSATDSEEAADVSLAAANFVGEWDDLTGAYNVPTSCFHDDDYWMLLVDLVDVTTKEPGVDPEWQSLTASTELVEDVLKTRFLL